MHRSARTNVLSAFARAGFKDLGRAREQVRELAQATSNDADEFALLFAQAPDADAALNWTREIHERHPDELADLDQRGWERLLLLLGASPALGEFFARNPRTLRQTIEDGGKLRTRDAYHRELLRAVGADESSQKCPFAEERYVDSEGANALRIRYRELVTEVMLFDLIASRSEQGALAVLESVSEALSSLAGAAFEAALAVARTTLVVTGGQGVTVSRSEVLDSRLAVVAMGKCGAEELNVVSDLDVIFVGETSDESRLTSERAIAITTRLASESMRAIHDPALEPPLWQVDANLRPEGRSGALVRTLKSHLAYYDRWAKTWEFQALLKARPLAGDLPLGENYVMGTRSYVWASASRDDFVGTVRRMRERVTEHINEDELDVQLKLGPGGLRDVEFSVQLLQLVHGQHDESLRLRGTLESLEALVAGGYVARADGERLGAAYRFIRVLEHRLQLRDLRRTEIMPTDDAGLRILARASGLASTGTELEARWHGVRSEVRELHLKIFYAPLLSAIAALPDEEMILGGEEALARLRGLGFRDPEGAMRHLIALTRGTSRRATIQRNLLPVLLHWFAEGADPDYGLLAFRRISEALGEAPWYLRLLRDGIDTAERLTHVLSVSRFAGDLLERHPEAVGWLEYDAQLKPPGFATIQHDMEVVLRKTADIDGIAERFRTIHRREILRLALGSLVGINSAKDVADGLDVAHTALLGGLLRALRRQPRHDHPFEFSLIGMGRYGGRELGFAGDVDLIAVFRTFDGADATDLPRHASNLASELRALVSDPQFHIDLDFDLRPEGKNGPLARSLDAYQKYYERWAGTWEAQALLRARFVAGDMSLGRDFTDLVNTVRYPQVFDDQARRNIRRIKARVEAERMPQGAEPRRQLKLGPGALSDVEWLVQLLQLEHSHAMADLRSVSTLECLQVAVDADLLTSDEVDQLRSAWQLASDIRSAIVLWSGRGSDVLPSNRVDLEGIARILGYPPHHTTELEEDWFSATRRARTVFEHRFYGIDEPAFPLR